jgi:glycosyltransferase involved in cell wall biosynthesis
MAGCRYLKILMLVMYNPFHTFSGTEIYAGNLAKSLESLGCELDIVCSDKQAHTSQITQGITITTFARMSNPLLNVFNDYYRRLNITKQLLKKSKFDAVLAVGAGQGLIFRDLARIKSRPPLLYFTFDCMRREGNEVLKVLSLKKAPTSKRSKIHANYLKFALADELSCRYSDLIFAGSADTMRSLHRYYRVKLEKIKVKYAGIPSNYSDGFYPTEPKEPIFLHVATNHERKGTIYLLKALRLLKEKYHLNATVWIVGEKDPSYVNMAKSFNIQVFFMETKISMHREIYASCTALVVPSVSEGFCLPVIEAAIFGKPAIVSNAGSLPELVDDGIDGFVVPVGDISGLAQKMFILATDPEVVKQMSAKAKDKARRFEIIQIANATLNSIKLVKQ